MSITRHDTHRLPASNLSATVAVILAEMEQFQANCEATEHTDTGIVHELIYDWRCRLNEANR